jgi:hypothetical protein
MKTTRNLVSLLMFVLTMPLMQCGKSSTTDPVQEADLVLKIDPSPVSGVNPSLSASYAFTARITSALPKSGVNLEFETTEELTGTSVDKKQSKLMVSAMDLTTITLTPGVVYVVKVTVTSLSKPTNTSTLSFRLARK